MHADSRIPYVEVNGLFIIDVEVNGVTEHFIFDSGATDILIDNQYGLKVSKGAFFSTADGVLQSEKVILNKMVVGGNITIRNQHAFTMDMSVMSSFTAMDIRGIIGAKLFTGILQFDFANQEIIYLDEFTSYEVGYSQIPFSLIDGLPIVTTVIDGQSHSFIFDSGATSHIIGDNVINGLTNREYLVSTTNLLTATGSTVSTQKLELDFKLGVYNYVSKSFIVQDMSEIQSALEAPISGILSISALNLSSLIMDMDEGVLYLK